MPKYYVSSGNLRTVLESVSHQDAAILFLKCFDGKLGELAIITKVSERGDGIHHDDIIFPTLMIVLLYMGIECPSPGDNDFLSNSCKDTDEVETDGECDRT